MSFGLGLKNHWSLLRMKHFEYPAQTGFYKVKVKNGSGWNNYKTCRLQISVGQSKHEGEKLKSVFDWSMHRFDQVIVCVNDSLQRWNLMHDACLSEEKANQVSHDNGLSWIKRNLSLYPHYNFRCIRWDHWLSHPDYQNRFAMVLDLYDTSEIFKQAVEDEIDEFQRRKKGKIFDNFKTTCRSFLLEETAVFMLMFETEDAADIYPGTTLLPVRLIQEGKIAGVKLKGNVHFTRIDFSKNRSFSIPETA